MLAMDTTLVTKQGECSKTRCGPCGKGSRCRVVWSGLGAYRHGQKIFTERAGHSTSGIPGPGEGVTRDHPEGQRLSLGQGNHRRQGPSWTPLQSP